jgi:hypothetical protein
MSSPRPCSISSRPEAEATSALDMLFETWRKAPTADSASGERPNGSAAKIAPAPMRSSTAGRNDPSLQISPHASTPTGGFIVASQEETEEAFSQATSNDTRARLCSDEATSRAVWGGKNDCRTSGQTSKRLWGKRWARFFASCEDRGNLFRESGGGFISPAVGIDSQARSNSGFDRSRETKNIDD